MSSPLPAQWPVPLLTSRANAPADFQALASGIETTFSAAAGSAYVPTWRSEGSIQPVNPLTSAGFFQLRQSVCDVWAHLTFGPSTGGGSGVLLVSLPVPAVAALPEQLLLCKTYVPFFGTFYGRAVIMNTPALRLSSAFPLFPRTAATSSGDWWRSTNTGGVGEGVPLVSGQYPIRTGGSFTMSGRYFTEVT